jgi:hypothetical protein
MFNYQNETYLIFLDKKYFKKSLFSSIYEKIREDLENKGIQTVCINDIIERQNWVDQKRTNTKQNNLDNEIESKLEDTKSEDKTEIPKPEEKLEPNNKLEIDSAKDKPTDNKETKTKLKNKTKEIINWIELSFDDKKYPDTNKLYIHLADGQYYNDSIYTKKKTEKEREMLLLIAGKLGVKESKYSIEVMETKIKKASTDTKINIVNVGAGYEKTVIKSRGQTAKELYLNRGAPVYLESKTTTDVCDNIRETIGQMKSKVFSYDYFIKNQKLESFVHKRFAFKMSKLEYTIEEDDISDLSFGVKACFMDYGINLDYTETVITREKISYTFIFYPDEDLRMVFNQRDFELTDEFVTIRRTYEKSDNKDLSIHHICEYVMEESKKSFYKQNGSIYHFFGLLNNWIMNDSYKKFIDVCRTFYSTIQIKNWFYLNLTDATMQVIYLDKKNNEIKNLVKLGVVKNKKPTINRFNSFVMDDTSSESYNVESTDLEQTDVLANIIVNLENEKQSNRNYMMLRQQTNPITAPTSSPSTEPNEQNLLKKENEELKNIIMTLENKLTEENGNLTRKFKYELNQLAMENVNLNNKILVKESETNAIKIHLEQVTAEKNRFIENLKEANSTNTDQQTNSKNDEKILVENQNLKMKECELTEQVNMLKQKCAEHEKINMDLNIKLDERNILLEQIEQENIKLIQIIKCLEETNLKNKNDLENNVLFTTYLKQVNENTNELEAFRDCYPAKK